MELLVGRRPGFAESQRVVRIHARRPIEDVVGGQQARLPTEVAFGDRTAQHQPLDRDASFGQLGQVTPRQRRHHKTLVCLGAHQALFRQPDQRLANHADTRVELLGQV